jgi:hypothetical protein
MGLCPAIPALTISYPPIHPPADLILPGYHVIIGIINLINN